MAAFPLEFIYNGYRKLVANPKYRWWVIAGSLCYVLSPIDIAPDFIPFIGEIDDAVVVTMLVTELAGVLRDRIAASRIAASRTQKITQPMDTIGMVDVVAIEA
jgi:uncharacterized membrane protein YkvA (DUF1232 family)